MDETALLLGLAIEADAARLATIRAGNTLSREDRTLSREDRTLAVGLMT